MDEQSTDNKGPLARGDVSAIARKLGLSVPHVSLCIRGLREPGPKLRREIERMRTRRAEQMAESAA